MSHLRISEAFAHYGAKLRNAQWSVSAWAGDRSLVVSLWNHHCRKGPSGVLEFADSFDRWSGHGNAEFRENVRKAHAAQSVVRLVIARTEEVAKVQSGGDASTVKKDYFVRDDLIGRVSEITDAVYVFQFTLAK